MKQPVYTKEGLTKAIKDGTYSLRQRNVTAAQVSEKEISSVLGGWGEPVVVPFRLSQILRFDSRFDLVSSRFLDSIRDSAESSVRSNHMIRESYDSTDTGQSL